MTIYRFKSHEEAAKALWTFNPDADYYKRVSRLFQIAFKLSPMKCVKGIQVFTSIEKAAKKIK